MPARLPTTTTSQIQQKITTDPAKQRERELQKVLD
jgi:hypothetical protein